MVLTLAIHADVSRLSLPIILLAFGAVSFAGDEVERHAFRDWAMRCDTKGACLLEQRIFVEASKEPLMHVSLQYAGANRQLMAAVRVPLGVVLAEGLSVAVDGDAPQKVPFHHCRSEGCLAIFPVRQPLAGRFRAGLSAELTVNLVDGKRVSVPASLMGVTAGLRALRERDRAGN